jgi:hypothetical protein
VVLFFILFTFVGCVIWPSAHPRVVHVNDRSRASDVIGEDLGIEWSGRNWGMKETGRHEDATRCPLLDMFEIENGGVDTSGWKKWPGDVCTLWI